MKQGHTQPRRQLPCWINVHDMVLGPVSEALWQAELPRKCRRVWPSSSPAIRIG